MKYLGLFAILIGLAACESTTTGRKSECFGREASDGTYAVTRNATNTGYAGSMSFHGGNDDCSFQSF